MLPSEIIKVVPLNGKPAKFIVSFTVLQPISVEVSLVDMDPRRPGVCYACQEEHFTKRGNHVWRIPIPIGMGKYFNEKGEDLVPMDVGFMIRINKTGDAIGNYIKFNSLVVNDYKLKPTGFNKKEAEFSQFLTEFALQAAYLPTGVMYNSNAGNYHIDYKDTLPDNPVTPMRRAENTNYIQAQANLIRTKPVPRIIYTGFHEFSHEDLNSDPDNESQADINGVRMFLKSGWPKYEAKMGLKITFDRATPEGWQTMNNPGLKRNMQEQKERMLNLDKFLYRSNFLNA